MGAKRKNVKSKIKITENIIYSYIVPIISIKRLFIGIIWFSVFWFIGPDKGTEMSSFMYINMQTSIVKQ